MAEVKKTFKELGLEMERLVRETLSGSAFEFFGKAVVSRYEDSPNPGGYMEVKTSGVLGPSEMKQILKLSELGFDVTYYSKGEYVEINCDFPLKGGKA